ncbi:TetR/AcrR family transcriptional regulator C-terminal domain-containing protein [Amycolatopsis jejuensis]|uniref:TetR/AcrR family transcriptional regulator C-terminal domain-containing protein n=1 Tax=Amycolatopsis jejuensis TaxID=330084 RepID=UPI000525ABA7|nr:TetR/AcrR family transcriptional regulator C-terminal domain-containing protein [Amycolatopsis jejuensis]
MVQLRRDDVLAGALELLDADGLDSLTMRKLGTHLGIQAGSLYWHFPGKQALLDAMADQIVAQVGTAVPDGGWDEQLADLARRFRAALLSRRDGARVVAGTYVTQQHTVALGQLWIDTLTRAGLGVEDAARASFTLSSFVLGHVIEEQGAAEAKPPEGAFAETVTAATFGDPESLFDYGLHIFLDGLRHQVA